MAITKMKKFTLLTFHEYKAELLSEFQKFEDVHFRNLQKADLAEMDFLVTDFSPEQTMRCESELDKVNFTLAKIAPYAAKAGLTEKRPELAYDEFCRYLSTYDYKSVCEKVKSADDRINAVKSEIGKLRGENEGLKAWGRLDVSPAALEALEEVRPLIGTMGKMAVEGFGEKLAESFENVYMELLGSIKDDVAVLLLTPSECYEELFSLCKDMGFARVNLNFDGVPLKIIERNNGRIAELDKERDMAVEEIRRLAGEHSALLIARDSLKTILAREKAADNFMKTDEVVLIEGWVPEEDSSAFHKILERVCSGNAYLEEEDVESDNTDVPIKLKNNPIVRAFESVTAMYSMPRYNEFDPTPILAPFYWLFFGLMVGDAGYGLIVMAGTALAMRFVDLKPGMKNFVRFFFYLSFAVIFGGILYGSMFGFPFFTPMRAPDGSPKAILDSQLDIVTMIIASIAIGIVHVLFGVLVKGAILIKQGKVLDAIFDSFFWFIAVLSGIIALLGLAGIMGGTIISVCNWLFVASLVGLAATQGRSSPSIGGKIGNGLYGVYGISSYVGDLVSYTRIVALALSGAYIAFSFNLMAGILPAGFVRVVFGFIIIFLGQTLNLGLGLLGAYVHTCRLQYVEFFGKFYEGGGVPFAPLKLQNEYTHIKK